MNPERWQLEIIWLWLTNGLKSHAWERTLSITHSSLMWQQFKSYSNHQTLLPRSFLDSFKPKCARGKMQYSIKSCRQSWAAQVRVGLIVETSDMVIELGPSWSSASGGTSITETVLRRDLMSGTEEQSRELILF